MYALVKENKNGNYLVRAGFNAKKEGVIPRDGQKLIKARKVGNNRYEYLVGNVWTTAQPPVTGISDNARKYMSSRNILCFSPGRIGMANLMTPQKVEALMETIKAEKEAAAKKEVGV